MLPSTTTSSSTLASFSISAMTVEIEMVSERERERKRQVFTLVKQVKRTWRLLGRMSKGLRQRKRESSTTVIINDVDPVRKRETESVQSSELL